MTTSRRPGDMLAGRYLMMDLLSETDGAWFWRGYDKVLFRSVAVHVIADDDERADPLIQAARVSATVADPRVLRVLDANRRDDVCYVVNEWGEGISLDILLGGGPLAPRRAAWIVSEVADTLITAHKAGVAHGWLVPENILIDHNGTIKIIGFAVDAAMHGLPPGRLSSDVIDLAALLYAALTGKWPGVSRSALPPAPLTGGQPLRPRKVRAGIPRPLDSICDRVLAPIHHSSGAHASALETPADIRAALLDFVGDPTEIAAAEAAAAAGVVPRMRPEDLVGAPAQGPQIRAPGTNDAADTHDATGTAERPAVSSTGDAALPQPPEPEQTDPSTEEADPGTTTQSMPATPDGPDASSADPDATVAGVPMFADDEWHRPRPDKPPPPPQLKPPPARPLYDPDPVRRPRNAEQGANVRATDRSGSDDYWPWPQDSAAPAPARTDDAGSEREVPGRSWMRLAAGIAAVVLLVIAVLFAVNLSRDRSSDGSLPSDSNDATTIKAEPVEVVGVRDFDPQGSGEEHREDTGNVLDKDPQTTWTTVAYDDQLGPTGLKDGVGLVLDLGGTHAVREVEVDFATTPTTAQVFVSKTSPVGAPQGAPDAKGTAEPDPKSNRDAAAVTLSLDPAVDGRFVLVWLTSLPEGAEGFRGTISKVSVRS